MYKHFSSALLIMSLVAGYPALHAQVEKQFDLGSKTVRPHLRILDVSYTADSLLVLSFPDSAQVVFSQKFADLGDAAAFFFFERLQPISRDSAVTRSAWKAFTGEYADLREAAFWNKCQDSGVICGQYSLYPLFSSEKILDLQYDGRIFRARFPAAQYDSSLYMMDLTESFLTGFIADRCLHNWNGPRIRMSDTAAKAVASVVAKQFVADMQKKKLADEKNARLAQLSGDVGSIVDEMSKYQDVAFTVALKKDAIVTEYSGHRCHVIHKSDKRKKDPKDQKTGDRKMVVDSVWISTNDYMISTVRVFAHDQQNPQKTTRYVNIIPLAVASMVSQMKTDNSVLIEESIGHKLFGRNDINYLHFNEVMDLFPGTSTFLTDYIPEDTAFMLTRKQPAAAVRKDVPASFFHIAAYTDMNGFIDNTVPNGKLQVEGYCVIPMNTRCKKMWMGNSFTLFKDVLPELCLSKVGDDNRLLTVRIDTFSVDSVKHVNNLQLYQHINFWAGGRINVFTTEGRNSNSTFYFNYRFRYMKCQFADTLFGNKRIFTSWAVSHEMEFYFERKLSKQFSLGLVLQMDFLQLYDNSIRVSCGKIYNDDRDNRFVPETILHFNSLALLNKIWTAPQFIWTPQINLEYRSRNSPYKSAFARIAFPSSFISHNGYLVAQIGISRPLSTLFSSQKKSSEK
ncbi:MAG TPA: hypothetical protein VFU15_14450 [Bacteroidia bacterium]|nr:hypothetical protein [Bacteroidia bacterium]